MSLFDAKLNDVTEADLQALMDGQLAESRVLDYKRDRIGNSQSDRQEFLADVTSFANAAGGHLILGVEEAKGIPTSIPGIECDDPDSESLRLEQHRYAAHNSRNSDWTGQVG